MAVLLIAKLRAVICVRHVWARHIERITDSPS